MDEWLVTYELEGQGKVRDKEYKGHNIFLEVKNMLIILNAVMVLQMCMYVRT